ncbi:MAG TPA: flagellar biosynthesis protein FlhF [Steroidobacteraceae bacterium]|jgi:flagellar biosynthesis protein FlhF|nr:flagellar biosynthesis protein FlhF [Steroidobacteraceae bacterium]
MKITRHTAPDMRQALRAVRDQLGPDAVILTSRRTPTGVEVTAAMDFDAEASIAAATPVATPTERATSASHALSAPAAGPAPLGAFASTAVAGGGLASTPEPASVRVEARASASDPMSEELKTLRRMLESQLAQLAWNDLARRAPVHTEILRELTEIGVAQGVAAEVVAHLPADVELTHARRLAIAMLAQRLLVTGDRWLEDGGTVALVGPTGVGKTTTLAKLAVRWVLRHGARDLALVAADVVRIAAQDQVQTLGQLLGAQVYTVDEFAELPELLARLGRYRFVLIDTPGSSQRDVQLAGRLALLNGADREIETALVLAASTQAGALAEAVRRFAPARPASCVLTKVDEATSLGGVLSTLIDARLPISYMSEGQRVPEDLRPARALELVTSAVQLAKSNGAAADEDLLKRRFGEVAHALA